MSVGPIDVRPTAGGSMAAMAPGTPSESAHWQCATRTLAADDGAELTVCTHGGHVIGWTPAGGRPRLWLSPTARCGPGQAIRGGIPVIFPQFAARGPLPKHGFARDRGWEELGGSEGREASWTAVLVASEQTRLIWPHDFELTLTATASGDRLDTTLTVTNTGDGDLSFTAALHSYLALGDPETRVHGLNGRTAEDNADGGAPVKLGGHGEIGLRATERRDVAVLGVDEPLLVDDPVLGPLTVTAEGFGDRVMWNPGPRHGLADVPEGDEKAFVCVEPAALSSIVVHSTGTWSGRQTLRARTFTTPR
jgi:glucose-6-phosphate 1-epimerase